MSEEWPCVPAGTVTRQRREAVRLEAGVDYRTMGVRWYGKGAYSRGTVTTESIKAKSLYRARSGDFVFNRIDTQNGAFDVINDELDGFLVTNEFPLYEVDAQALDARFLLFYFQQAEVQRQIGLRRAGSEGRARWKEPDFEAWTIPLPPLPVQERIVEVIGAVDHQIAALDSEVETGWLAHGATREWLLSTAPRVPLASVCGVEARLVDPRLDEYADLIHVGVEAITKETGDIVEAKTARADALISGKFLFGRSDVIFSKIRPSLRKVAVPGFEGLCSADAYPLTPVDGIPPTMLRESLLENRFVDQVISMSGRTKMPKVNRTQLFSLDVAMPDPEDRQRVDAALLALRDQIAATRSDVERLRAVRAALLTSLFNRDMEITDAERAVA
ncbi:restriction endonuclease subunit S [Promicromonospora sukumoe]|uniref:restriction endonuclease subunit S n=1 Tax=Promicromonospora sukumoe TaxID=88382 RepID=UPI00364BA6E4